MDIKKVSSRQFEIWKRIYRKNLVTSAGQNTISQKSLIKFNFQSPPIKEQMEIVKKIKQTFLIADRIKNRYDILNQEINKLPTSILSKAFKGELVPQEPNDEPASMLLERIKAEKEGNVYKLPKDEVLQAAEPNLNKS